MVPQEEGTANSVPAAAVIQRSLALFGFTGRKGRVGGLRVSSVKAPGSTRKVRLKLPCSRPGEGIGIEGVAVKCVDILENTGGEGGFLERH